MDHIKKLEDIIRDNTIDINEQRDAIKCYKYVLQYYNLSGTEPINGNICLTINNVYYCVKIHPDETVSYVKTMTGSRDDYVKIGLKKY